MCSRSLVHWVYDTGGLWGRQYGRLEAVLGKRSARDTRSRGEVMLGSISPSSFRSAYTNPKLTSWSCGLELSCTVECRLDTQTASDRHEVDGLSLAIFIIRGG